MARNRQTGLATVEFAIVANLVLVMILGAFEVSRGYFVYATLEEVTRRGARLAAVCPINDPAIRQLAVFNDSGDNSSSPFIPDLAPGNLAVDYLDENNAAVGNPADPAEFARIRYVRVRLVGFQHQFVVPFVSGLTALAMPEFSSVLPRESLGVPREGAITPC